MSTEPTGFAPAAPQHFRDDLAKLNDALAPWVFTDPTGWRGILPGAPAALVNPYSDLVSLGYANGWFV